MKVKVYHGGYGCETGCCGHYVELDDDRTWFEFKHPDLPPWDDPRVQAAKKEWAISLAKKVIEKKWPECLPTIDWETIEFDEVCED